MHEVLINYQRDYSKLIFQTYTNKNTFLKHYDYIYKIFTDVSGCNVFNCYDLSKINYSKIDINFRYQLPNNKTIVTYWKSDLRYKIWCFDYDDKVYNIKPFFDTTNKPNTK